MGTIIAQNFAALVDGANFEEAGKFLTEDCAYQYSEGKYRGRDAIVNIFHQNHLQATRVFDEVVYSSSVEPLEDGTYKINFTDKLRMKHAWHESHFYQVITLAGDQIADIKHHEIPGEMEASREFYNKYR